MLKSEILDLVLDHITEIFNQNPDSFVFYTDDSEYSNKAEYIAWQTDQVSSDPTVLNCSKSILIKFAPSRDSISLFLFNKNFSSIKDLEGGKFDSAIEVKKTLMKIRKPYKKFKRLKKMIKERDKKRENEIFMRKLTSFFPTMLDEEIFGGGD